MGACSETGRMKGGNVGLILPSSSCAWRLLTWFLGTLPLVSKIACLPNSLVSSMLRVIILVIKLLTSKIFPAPILCCSLIPIQTQFSENLRIHNYILISVTHINFPHRALPHAFLLSLHPSLASPRLVFGPLRDRKTVSLHFIDGGMRE